MKTFERILRDAVDVGASDVHPKIGVPVIFRIAHIVPAHLRTRLEAEHEIDFAHAPPGAGRFRVNIILQRGGHPVTAGHISQAEALAHSPNPEALKMRFQGVTLNETRRILGARE